MSRKPSDLPARILSLLRSEPGLSSVQIAERFSVSRATVFVHLRTLAADAKVRAEGQRKATRYYVADPLGPITGGTSSTESLEDTKKRLLQTLSERYGEEITTEDLEASFDEYCLYIAPDDTVWTGFQAFTLWCRDPKHDFSDRIVEKAIEYLEIRGSIEYRRAKSGLLDATESARSNLQGIAEAAFDRFYFLQPSVLENGFGRTRTAIELYYGKLGNTALLKDAICRSVPPIREYARAAGVDCLVFTPPTSDRRTQFRDVLRTELGLKLPEIRAEKAAAPGRILQPQKDIRDREQRVKNAFISLRVTIPTEVAFFKHVLILDDSFTTGATPNAIALKLRETGYQGKITVLTVCGSFNYALAVSEMEV